MLSFSDTEYAPESAGRLMRTDIPVSAPDFTLGEVEALLRDHAVQLATVDPVYIVDEDRRLIGVLPLRSVFGGQPEEPVQEVMEAPPVTVRPWEDQERAALVALRDGISSVPVSGDDGRLLGAIPTRSLLQVLDSEAVEDILKIGGVIPDGQADPSRYRSVFASVGHRLPWLILGLFGSLVTAGVVSRFQGVLAEHIILAAFIPLIAYVAAAISIQMSAFVIREMTDHRPLRLFQYLGQQLVVVAVMSLILAVIVYVVSIALYGVTAVLALAIAAGLFTACLSALISGLGIPFLFYKLRFDPADATGPMATILQDLFSISLYLGIASLLL